MNELLKKMNYKKGNAIVVNPPEAFKPVLASWQEEISVEERPQPGRTSDFLLVFTADSTEVAKILPPLAGSVGPATVFWVAFPKQTSKRYHSDINRDKLWILMSEFGFRPNRNVAIDDDWSALRFALI